MYCCRRYTHNTVHNIRVENTGLLSGWRYTKVIIYYTWRFAVQTRTDRVARFKQVEENEEQVQTHKTHTHTSIYKKKKHCDPERMWSTIQPHGGQLAFSVYPSGKRSNFFFISFHDHLTPKNKCGDEDDATSPDIARHGKNIIKIDLLSSSSSGGYTPPPPPFPSLPLLFGHN